MAALSQQLLLQSNAGMIYGLGKQEDLLGPRQGFSKGRHFSAVEMSWQTSPNLSPAPWYFQLLLLQPYPMPGQT